MDRKLPGISAPHVDEYEPHLLSREQFNLRSDLWHHSTHRPDTLDYVDSDEPLHVGTRQAAFERDDRDWMLSGHITSSLDNTPDTPVSDAYANLASHGMEAEEASNYMSTYLLEQGKDPSRYEDELDPWGFSDDLPDEMDRGLYYRNDSEDRGSISAVVRTGDFRTHPSYVSEAQARGERIPTHVAQEHWFSPPADSMSDVVEAPPPPGWSTSWIRDNQEPPLFREVHNRRPGVYRMTDPSDIVGYVPTELGAGLHREMGLGTTGDPNTLTTSLNRDQFPDALDEAVRDIRGKT